MDMKRGCSPYCQDCGACSARNGRTKADPVATQDDFIDNIVGEVVKTLAGEMALRKPSEHRRYPKIPLGVSNRHIHMREETFKVLFGPDTRPSIYRYLYQPEEFALSQTCIIVGPKMRPIHDVRILGPFRKYDQVELSFTDSVVLGINPPVRDSGDLKDAVTITIVGPAGSVVLNRGAIIANRHVHMTTADAATFGVSQGDYIRIKVPGVKSTTFENVLVRTNDAWKLQLHLDTDDANAAHVVCNQEALFLGKD
jgi:putative phosphotransacetylase